MAKKSFFYLPFLPLFLLLSCTKQKNADQYPSCNSGSYSDTLYESHPYKATASFSGSTLHIFSADAHCSGFEIYTNDTTLGQHKVAAVSSGIYMKYYWSAYPSQATQSGETVSNALDTGLLTITKINPTTRTISGKFNWRSFQGSFSHVHW